MRGNFVTKNKKGKMEGKKQVRRSGWPEACRERNKEKYSEKK